MGYINLFNEFISRFLTFESKVAYSKDFKKVLMRMKNPIAEELLKIEGQDKPVTNNYFDIKDGSNDIVSFITDRKYKEMSAKVQYGKYQIITFDVLNPIESNARFYARLDMTLPTKVTPIPNGQIGEVEKMWTSPSSGKVWVKFVPDDEKYQPIMINMDNLSKMWDDDVFFKQNRQDTRIGRSLRSLLTSLGIKFLDKDIEVFVNSWKSTVDQLNNIFYYFEIVDGDDIPKWYNYTKYETSDGQLGASCMREADDEFFDIYSKNQGKVSLIIFKSPEDGTKIKGRALLWKFDDGREFMDRIYTNRDSDIDLFREYAKSKGFFCKAGNYSTSDLSSFDPDGGKVSIGNIDIQLRKGFYDQYPYLDTFKFYSPSTGIITNDYRNRSGFYQLEDTDGSYNEMFEEDEEDEDNSIWVGFYSRYFDESELVSCEFGDIVPWSERPVHGYRLPIDCLYNYYYGFYVAKNVMEEIGTKCSVTGEWRLDSDLTKIYSPDSRSKSRYIIENYMGEDYLYSVYHDEFIPKELAIKVWSSMSKETFDWRVKNDKSWKEVEGEKYDKAILIDKDMKKESVRILKFNQMV